jgi:hypothetical protein
MEPLSSPGGVAELGEIGDVDLTGLENGDGIVFDSGTDTWGAGSPDGEFYVLGGTQAGGDAGGYTANGALQNPENVSGSTRSDMWWTADGLQVFTLRGSSPRISHYSVFPAYSLIFGDWTPLAPFTSIPVIGTNKFGMQLNPNGFELSLTNTGGSGLIQVHPMSVAFDVSTLGTFTSQFLISGGGLTRHQWHPNLLRFWVQQSGQIIKEFSTVSQYDVSPAPTLIQTFDFSVFLANLRGWTFSFDGLFLYGADGANQRLVSWQMSTPYDLSTVTVYDGVNGPDLNPLNNFNVPDGFYFRQSDGTIFMGDSLQSGSSTQRVQSASN